MTNSMEVDVFMANKREIDKLATKASKGFKLQQNRLEFQR